MTRSMDKRVGADRLTTPKDRASPEGDLLGNCLSPASFWWPKYLESSAWLDHAPFAFWLIDAHRPRTVVELGTHGGYSYFAFCQAVHTLGTETRCYAVDTWQGDEHAGFYDESVYERVKSHNDTHYANFSRMVRSSFDDALRHFSDGSIDLLHIDGRHFYEDVKHDFESWLPKLSDRAVVLFHDTNVRERNFGVFHLWEEIRVEFPSFEFLHGHGLGVLGYGSDLSPGLRALFSAALDQKATMAIRDAYNRLGAYPKQAMQHRTKKADIRDKEVASQQDLKVPARSRKGLSVKLEKREAELARSSAKLQQCERKLSKLSRHLNEMEHSTSWRITYPMRVLSRAIRWTVRNVVRSMRFVWWLMTGQTARAAGALRTIYARHVPVRIKKCIPGTIRKRVGGYLSEHESRTHTRGAVPSRADNERRKAIKQDIQQATAAFQSEMWDDTIQQWQAILTNYPDDARSWQAKLFISVARRIRNLEDYEKRIVEYKESKVARDIRRPNDGELRVAVYTAISGNYDSLKLPAVLDERIDYIVFTDTALPDTGIWQVRPITYFSDDATRTARFVKTHPHWLLADYDITIWIDSNVMILGDIWPLVSDFKDSGKAIGAIPHPQRQSIYEEIHECAHRAKDDYSVMECQVQAYRSEGFKHDDLIESNLMMANLGGCRASCERFFSTWWSQIDRHSRRDQLSKNYALRLADVEWHRLLKNGESVRNHRDFVLVEHDAGQGPASRLVAKLDSPLLDPYALSSDADTKEARVGAQRGRRIDVVVCVHNALEDVKLCLESIERERIDEQLKLILVDDGSDEDTADVLRTFAAKDWVSRIRNEKAVGYTKAANQGLAATTAPFVILLNSDTIVTSLWAEKLADAVYTTPGAGIVGPLSNAASYQSIPEYRGTGDQTAVNELPTGMTPEDMNCYCENWSTVDALPRTPLIHGFCFGLKREVLEAVGWMDEVTFPRGYGEENDFCFRAVDAGFGLVVATNTYVFHRKSRSYMGAERVRLMKAGSEALSSKHGRARVQRAVRSMEENSLLACARASAEQLYRLRSGNGPCIWLVPARNRHGRPLGSAYIRLLLPYFHDSILDDFKVKEATNLPDLEADSIAVLQRDAPGIQLTALQEWISKAKKVGMTLVHDIDDDLLDLQTLVRLGKSGIGCAETIAKVSLLASSAHTVIASSDALARKLGAFNESVVVVPNGIDVKLWGLHEADRRNMADNDTRENRPVKIGYVGTPTHYRDLELIAPAIRRIEEKYGSQVCVEVVGAFEDSQVLFGSRIGLPKENEYPEFVKWLRQKVDWDIAVIPLLDDSFNRSKSYIKFLECAAMNAAIVVSDVPAYREVARNGENCVVVKNDCDEWEIALVKLIENRDAVRYLARRASHECLSTYTLDAVAPRLKTLLAEVQSVGRSVV
ncbi:class I SAM-dependent methyltransferase [Thioalkalivibrio sp. ALE20]|uniref:class I SAM-dependent methyltransferase n=1 Tax=Thioalkalivibrio sp. ALE20 TaxID=545275 RepID=UPI0003A9C4E4|nr:class I SAM-dependent methyltransferase [Thioalkalivibrio sp. ALE20]